MTLQAKKRLAAAILAVPGVRDLRSGFGSYLGSPPVYVELLLHHTDADALSAHLEADVVDRVEVAAVVETLGEMHPLKAPPELCPTCSERTPCRTRRLLTELPGGAT